MIISSTTDIATWIDNTRADVRETGGQAAVDAAVEALRAADHPAWGTDWSDYLDASDEVVNEAAAATWGTP